MTKPELCRSCGESFCSGTKCPECGFENRRGKEEHGKTPSLLPGDGDPKRRYEVAIYIGADTPEDIIKALHAIELEYAMRGVGHNITSGSPDYGFLCADRENPNQSHDVYFREVAAWIDQRQADSDPAKEKC